MKYDPFRVDDKGGSFMANLTQKELLLLQDNIGMCQDTADFIQASMDNLGDIELKSMCQQMLKEHQQGSQRLAKHIMQAKP